MSRTVFFLFWVFFLVRLSSLFISIRNEKRLRREGAEEYGKKNSAVLAVLHVLFYLGAFAEGYVKNAQLDGTAVAGAALYVAGLVMLFYVIRQLSPIWTVKLFVAKEHTLNKSKLFKYARHPNYFLSILPELIGLVLLLKAYVVLAALFPLYLLSLAVRIIQEEKVMRARFKEY